MAEKDERTEQATAGKLQKLRNEGQVLSSPDVTSAAILLAVAGAVAMTGSQLALEVLRFSTGVFRLQHWQHPTDAISEALPALQTALVPLITAAVAAFAVGLAQSRVFSFGLVRFKLERLDPSTHIQQVLPGKQAFLEVAKQLLKLIVIGIVVYRVVADAIPKFAQLAATEVTVGAATIVDTTVKLAIQGGIAFIAISAFDFWLAHRRFNEDSMMSKQEVKDEAKEDDGNPQVRQKIRQRFREIIKKSGVAGVKQATVLVTNPTHLSIALRYIPETDLAPVLLSKGTELVALQMRTEARKRGVPIVEHRPLARALYAKGKEGRPIPTQLYRAAAEVIVHVMRLRAGVQNGATAERSSAPGDRP
jgi:flagellar biosynthesis protein FlhB